MPTNRSRVTRSRKASTPIDESIRHYLLTGKEPGRGQAAWEMYVDRLFDDAHEAKDAWTEHRAALMADWKNQNKRGKPWAEREFSQKTKWKKSDADEQKETNTGDSKTKYSHYTGCISISHNRNI